MGTSTMNMATATGTGTAAAATTTAAMSMGGSSSCKISMLWNWTVMDACFIARSWHITSKGMFAGSCIGVILLVMSLEFLRRSVKEYDRFIIKNHTAKYRNEHGSESGKSEGSAGAAACAPIPAFRPNIFQQAIRALLHMMQFAVAYFVMLLAMYYNGYIIICIFIGSYLGSFIFHWEPLTAAGTGNTSASKEATVCCG